MITDLQKDKSKQIFLPSFVRTHDMTVRESSWVNDQRVINVEEGMQKKLEMLVN